MKTGTAILAIVISIVVVAALTAPAQGPTPVPSVWLQPTSPGSTQTGNIRINGKYVGTLSNAFFTAAISITASGQSVRGIESFAQGGNSSGVYGNGWSYGVFGDTNDQSGIGVYGQNTGGGTAVRGFSPSGTGVRGESNFQSGVVGVSYASGAGGVGVFGSAGGNNGSAGVHGVSSNAAGYGVVGTNHVGTAIFGYTEADTAFAVSGQNNVGVAVRGLGVLGVLGEGSLSDGVRGTTSASGAAGVSGIHPGSGIGVYALSTNGTALEAYGGGYTGIYGTGPVNGIHGLTANNSASAVYALNTGNGWGVYGASGTSGGTGTGVAGVNGNAAGYAVYSNGNFTSSGGKSFQIDHPFDPENKYLNHFCTEGAEPLNVYSGTVTTDDKGFATVALPDYFAEINKNPRIQLTVVDDSDDFVMAKVTKKVEGCQFTIRTSKPGVEVFWRVEATRNDNWMRVHGFKVEQEKPEQYRGKYLNPEFFGKPETSGQFYMPKMEGTAQKLKR
jgi:hypothetical protein